MRLNQQLVFAVRFAKFAAEMGIPPADLAQMVAHHRAATACYQRGDDKGEQKHGGEVERLAALHGCKVDWPGLNPHIQKGDDKHSNRPLPTY